MGLVRSVSELNLQNEAFSSHGMGLVRSVSELNLQKRCQCLSEKITDDDSSSHSDTEPLPIESSICSEPVHEAQSANIRFTTLAGGGKLGDIFLWKNKTVSGEVLSGSTVAWVLFELLDYQLLTLVCHFLIFALALLFLWSNASTFINNSSPCIPQLHLPEDKITDIVSDLTLEINRGLAILRDIASRRDLNKFLYVMAGLWFLSIMGKRWNLLTLLYIAIVLLFTIPIV